MIFLSSSLFLAGLCFASLACSSSDPDELDDTPREDAGSKKDTGAEEGDSGGAITLDGSIDLPDAPSVVDAGTDAMLPTTAPGLTYTLAGIKYTDDEAFGKHSPAKGFETKVYGYGSNKAAKAGLYTRLIIDGGFPTTVGDYGCSAATTPTTGVFELIGQGWTRDATSPCVIHITSSSTTSLVGTLTATYMKAGQTSPVTASFNYPIKTN